MDVIPQCLFLFVIALIVIITLQYYWQRWPVNNFPPGPTGLPVIGTHFHHGSELHFNRTASKLVQLYGNVCSFMMGTPIMLANGVCDINEVFSANRGLDFASRHDPAYVMQLFNPNKLGLFTPDYSERWVQHRRFVLSTLRGLGFGKTKFEKKITAAVNTLSCHLKELPKIPHDLGMLLHLSVASNLYDTILGCQYDYDDNEFQRAVGVLDELLKKFGETSMVLMEFVPYTRPFLQHSVQEMKAVYVKFSQFVMNKVAEHQKVFSVDNEPFDFVDCYLIKMAEDPYTFTLDDLEYILLELFAAGTDTTASTLQFALLYMIVNPDVQHKVHQELIEVVGDSRLPCLEDQDNLPYTSATMYEIQRLACITPTITRCATVNTTLGGFAIPKGTNVICNTWGLHYDPVLWPDPDRFDPSRHLNDQGAMVSSTVLPLFGAGRRVCMGESLARMELFLFFSTLMHQFRFELPPDVDPPSLEPVPGFNASPQPFQVIIKEC